MVKTIELQLDETTIAQAQHLAQRQQSTLEVILTKLIEQLASLEQQADPIIGMFAGEPDILDQIVEITMLDRETHPLRISDG